MGYFTRTRRLRFFFQDFKANQAVWPLRLWEPLTWARRYFKASDVRVLKEEKPKHKENVREMHSKSW